jgi:hypothetical protein
MMNLSTNCGLLLVLGEGGDEMLVYMSKSSIKTNKEITNFIK